MANFVSVGPYGPSGNGTNITPETWIPSYQELLPYNSQWAQHIQGEVDGDALLAAGNGDTIRVNYFGNISILHTNLTDGTFVAKDGTQASYQTSLTVYPYGQALTGNELQFFTANGDLKATALSSVVKNALMHWNDRIGSAALGAPYAFAVRGETTLTEGTTGLEGGTTYLLPYHIRNLRANYARKGIAPFEDGFYHCIGAPGAFGAIRAQSEWYNVGDAETRRTGLLGYYEGVAFFEEKGPGNSLTWSTTSGTSVFMGAAGLIGDTTIGRDPNSFAMWHSSEDFPGRTLYFGWYGKYCAGLAASSGTSDARIHLVYSKHE
jgi:hypothetical protein